MSATLSGPTAPIDLSEPSDVEVTCRTCHRTERWRDGGAVREVVVIGGGRRPTVHPDLAAWELLLEVHHGQSAPVVAACPACDQPMVGAGPSIPWTVHTPEGDLEVQDHTLRGPTGSLSWADADALVRRHHEDGLPWADYVGPKALMQGSAVALMLTPVALWVAAACTVVLFLVNFYR